MKPEYKQKNKLWVYSFVNKELFSLPAEEVPERPVFLYDQYPESKILELAHTHTMTSISFWSCEEEDVLKKRLDGVLPDYFMVKLYNNWCKCIIVAEGTENIYKDVKKSGRSYESPGDVMVRVSYNGRLVRTQKSKVLPYDSQICKK